MSAVISGQYYDLSFLAEIADGSKEFMVESIEMFLQQTPELLKAIDTGINTGDLKMVASAAHKLKPNLGFFGMTECQAKMLEIELLGKSGIDDGTLKSKYTAVSALIISCFEPLNQVKEQNRA